jgi:hypothetical protein
MVLAFNRNFYLYLGTITNKKAACLFPAGRLIFQNLFRFLYSKSPLARRILSCRPPPTTGILAVNLPHNKTIIPYFLILVKP